MSLTTTLPKVSTRKEYMDRLGEMMTTGAIEEFDEEAEQRGRPRELKSYIIEANTDLSPEFQVGGLEGTILDTGLQYLKILRLSSSRSMFADFYLDRTDKRFWVLHTNSLAKHSNRLVNELVTHPTQNLDMVWMPTQLLNEICGLQANRFNGFGIDFEDYFTPEGEEAPVEEWRMKISGTKATKALSAINNENELRGSIAWTRVQIIRGDRWNFAKDDVGFNGRVSAKEGKSIDDHASLIDSIKDIYRKNIAHIEEQRIGVVERKGHKYMKGKAFNLVFRRKVSNPEFFLSRLLNNNEPFRLWGLKTKISEGYYQVDAIDLHTGDPLNLEMSPDLLRIYLPSEACGNTVLRLYVHLQQFYDSDITCDELNFGV
ncbi:MAG: hypothetical protein HYY22_03050 [Thaumarchaeota archaeon]|nr:hypothetical protein [Nitrososphaerota archaeon]